MTEELQILTRIADALERQCVQNDEIKWRNVAWRDENVQRHIRERDEELAEARRTNEMLLAQIDQIVALNTARLNALESAPKPDAVDPVGREGQEGATRG